MSEQEYRIEWCGNMRVYHPIKREPVVYADWFTNEWEAAAQRFTQRGEAISFYHEVEERRAA